MSLPTFSIGIRRPLFWKSLLPQRVARSAVSGIRFQTGGPKFPWKTFEEFEEYVDKEKLDVASLDDSPEEGSLKAILRDMRAKFQAERHFYELVTRTPRWIDFNSEVEEEFDRINQEFMNDKRPYTAELHHEYSRRYDEAEERIMKKHQELYSHKQVEEHPAEEEISRETISSDSTHSQQPMLPGAATNKSNPFLNYSTAKQVYKAINPMLGSAVNTSVVRRRASRHRSTAKLKARRRMK